MDKATQSEIWKDIPEYEGWYEVSNLGRVRSYHNFGWGKREKPIMLKLYTSPKGYVQVSLCKDKCHRSVNVHRLVASAFLPDPHCDMQIDHINGNKEDNRAENLEWVTPKENTLRSLSNGLKPTGERHGMSKLTDYAVRDIRYLYKEGGYTHRKLGVMFGVSHSTIGKITRNEAWCRTSANGGCSA